jgi:ABC-type dipeptide/oligopeptide/nickel transport system permease subunit
MLQETKPVWQAAWWTAVVPGLAISFTVLVYNLFGDALRDALDPRLRGSR